ncbi:CubicO group peptidase (beta-lactamase class C family) [Aquimarina sp. MAR_2010_214]|uniref:serine hydrolase n=1 Tax=Aquimarina sp. MAR_2010_214 TaxID=1250026 RepID=UPI000C7100EA|nr:serine hydrolase [Aquimarina sp. MAR_2010_214]PKV51536.1 CubicO group peptidase (beta-lactamase class C family) [Aquimarina sp. MAR_2010_214]
MKNLFLIIVCSILIINCKNSPKEAAKKITTDYINNNTELDSLMQTCFKRGIFNGNILVLKNDSIIYKNSIGFADGSKTKSLNQNMLFNIGSISKEFSAVSIMKLVEENKINLDDEISKHLPNLPNWSNKIEIHHLLNYTSGLPRYNWDKVRTDEDVYNDLINIKKLETEPGTNFMYSNNNILLRKMIIEKISGNSYNDYVKENLLSPLGMESTFLSPLTQVSELAKGFSDQPNNEEQTTYDKMSGGTYITTNDMYKWISGLHTEKIINSKSKNILNTPFTTDYYTETSLGASNIKNGEMTRHQHSGSHVNYEALIDHNLDNGLTVILFTNTANHKLWKIDHTINSVVHNNPYLIPNHSIKEAIQEKCKRNIKVGVSYYYQLKKENIEAYNFDDQRELNNLGYDFLQKEKIDDAIAIFELLVSEFPNSANAYDSLGEAYFTDKNYDLALKNYKKSLELNPKNSNAKKWIETIEKT